MVFWMGVPVRSSLFRHWNCSRIFHRTLETAAVKKQQHQHQVAVSYFRTIILKNLFSFRAIYCKISDCEKNKLNTVSLHCKLVGKRLHHHSALPGAALQCLGLIQDHVLPLDPLEILDVLHHQLVARDHHVERRVLGVERFLRTKTYKVSRLWLLVEVPTVCSRATRLPHLAPKLADHLPIVRVSPVRQNLGAKHSRG